MSLRRQEGYANVFNQTSITNNVKQGPTSATAARVELV